MNNTAFITGTSNGIGYELAYLFAKNKTNLVLAARSKDKLDSMAEDIKTKFGVSVKAYANDISSLINCEEIYSDIKKENIRIDFLVNNAGFGNYGFFTDTDLQKELEMINLNIIALTYFTKVFATDMKQRGSGKILNVSSTAAFQPGPLMAVYYATKAYVQSFSEAIANELKESNVIVTALCPGPTESGFQSAAQLNNVKLFTERKLPTSAEVAKFGYDAMMKGKTVAVHGLLNKIGALGARFAPRKLLVKAVRKIQETRDR